MFIFSLIIEMFSVVYSLIIDMILILIGVSYKEILLQNFKHIVDRDTSKMSKIMVSVCFEFSQ